MMYIITDVVYQCIDFVLPSVFKIVCIYDVSTEINIFWLWLWLDFDNHEAGDLRRYRAHYDVIVMRIYKASNI